MAPDVVGGAGDAVLAQRHDEDAIIAARELVLASPWIAGVLLVHEFGELPQLERAPAAAVLRAPRRVRFVCVLRDRELRDVDLGLREPAVRPTTARPDDQPHDYDADGAEREDE